MIPDLPYLAFGALAAVFGVYAFYLVWTGKLIRRFHNNGIAGALTGATTAIGYLCFWEAIMAFDNGDNSIYSNVLSTMEVVLLVAIYGLIVGILPATILGALTGWVYQAIGKRQSVQIRPSVLMFLICVTFALLLHSSIFLWLRISIANHLRSFPSGAYLSMIGVPTLLYFIVGIRTAYYRHVT